MSEFIISSEQLERLIEGIEHNTGREITKVVCDGTDLDEIVRCRDCAYRGWSDSGGHFCARGIGLTVKPDGFCAWGERDMEWVTCKCGEDIERHDRIKVCPSCGRKVMA